MGKTFKDRGEKKLNRPNHKKETPYKRTREKVKYQKEHS